MARYVGLSRRALAAVGVVGLFFVALGLAFSFGVVDVPGSGGPGGAGGANESTAGVDARTAPAGRVGQYDFDVVRVRTCGFACRNVTTRLTNVGNDTAQDVTVRTRIYTGDELLWQDRERVGYLLPTRPTATP
ncbi:hypothetical protein [Halospeciosus flavus]|uniref:hypothetical protein n=1 Tax=Halospeciosus flavus TaxID=3032283 RepID=UPI0036178C86